MTEEWGAILVVDDDAEMRALVHDVLKDRGHQITMAGSRQEAMKRGASDYLTKPVNNDELVRVVERSIREASLRREVNRLRREVRKEYSFHQIIGKSKEPRPEGRGSLLALAVLFAAVLLVRT